MLTTERKAHLLELLHREGRVIAKDAADALGLSEDTIRRDLRELAAAGKLQRVHGGALPISPALADFTERQNISHAGKAAIGRLAAGMVAPGSVVIIDGGTTAVQMARQLPRELAATVVTHSPSIAVELAGHAGIEVILIGGRMFRHSLVATGAVALDTIARIRADTYFMGVTGVHSEAGLTTGDYEEAAIKRALSRAAAETIVLASSEKIGAASAFLVQPIDDVQSILTDALPQNETIRTIRAKGLDVVCARIEP